MKRKSLQWIGRLLLGIEAALLMATTAQATLAETKVAPALPERVGASGASTKQLLDFFDQGQGGFEGDQLQALCTQLKGMQQIFAMLGLKDLRFVEASCLLGTGLNKQFSGDYAGALEAYQSSLPIWQATGSRSLEGIALSKIAEVHIALGQYSRASDEYQQALAIFEDIGDRILEGATIANIGILYQFQGEYDKALEEQDRARAIFRGRKGFAIVDALILNNIGSIYIKTNRHHEGLAFLNQALDLVRETESAAAVKTPFNPLEIPNSVISGGGGDFLELLEPLITDYFIAQAKDAIEVTIKNNVGVSYHNIGEFEKAKELLEEVVASARKLGNPVMLVTSLNSLGQTYVMLEQNNKAEESFQEALKIAGKIDNQTGKVLLLNNIASLHMSREEYSEAAAVLQEALPISRKVADPALEGMTLNNLGFVSGHLGNTTKELQLYQETLKIARELGNPWMETLTLSNLGLSYEKQGNKTAALDSYEEAIALFESVQGSINIEQLKATFAGRQIDVYKQFIGLLWDEGKFEEAFNYVERARARAFLDQLESGRVNFRSGAAANLIGRERKLKDRIAALHNQRFEINKLEVDEVKLEKIERDLDDLKKERAELLVKLKIQSPEIASLVSIEPEFFENSLKSIQGLLEPDTTLVEYFVTEKRTFAFIITNNSFEAVELEASSQDLAEQIETFRNLADTEVSHPDILQKLHHWLIDPLQKHIKTSTVGIVPHGVLHYLPFAALTNGEKYLIDRYTLFNLPSGNVLRFLPEKRKPQTDSVLALGSPRIKETLPVLEFAAEEVNNIAQLFGTQAFIGAEATETLAKSQGGQSGILHIAAHGEYNLDNPLFSTVYLTADEGNDGRLEVHEIYELDLDAATNLVVLSACETKDGELSDGDEVVGLNRAFLFAGTPNVIASLWQVDDRATQLLMEGFYSHLRNGETFPEALRLAQNELRQNHPNYNSPYHWAGFVLTGDSGVIK